MPTPRTARTASALPWTHFYVHPDNKRITGYTPDTCEHCGADIQAPNSITLHETPERLQALGLVQTPTMPEEGYYSDTLGGEACYTCNA